MQTPYRLVSREHRAQDTVVEVCGVRLGGGHVAVIAGPCAVESRDSLRATAARLRQLGVGLLRGGAFKPRTSPYSFRGLGEEGLAILRAVGDELGMGVVTEVLELAQVETVAEFADVLQVGTRNMQNFALLEALGACNRPVLLKRGMAATIEELLCAAEYVVAAGNPDVILCERGVRGFEPSLRGTLDLGAVVRMRQLAHLPVIVDPSHATGIRELVRPAALGAIAAGADGVIVEAHHDPASSLVDGAQTIDLHEMGLLLDEAAAITQALGRRLSRQPATVAASRAGSAA